ncbi:MAG: Trp family transcriptional regulator [bacterium]
MKPQREIKDVEYEKFTRGLFQAFITFSDSLEAERFLKEILTPAEFLMLKRRWHVSCLLNEGYNVRQTAQKSGVSTQTVQAVKRMLSRSQTWLEYLPKRKPQQPTQAPSSPKDPAKKYIFG